MNSKTKMQMASILIISLFLIIGIYALYPDKVNTLLEADSFNPQKPIFDSVECVDEITRSHDLYFTTTSYSNGEVFQAGDSWEATYTCTGADVSGACNTKMTLSSVNCPQYYTPYYYIKMNDQCIYGTGYYADRGTYLDFCNNFPKYNSGYAFDKGQTIKVEATCRKDWCGFWETDKCFVPPNSISYTGIEVKQLEKSLVYYGHDVIKNNIPQSWGCRQQSLYDSELGSNQLTGFNDFTSVAYSIADFLKGSKNDKLIKPDTDEWKVGEIKLYVAGYKPIDDININYYNNKPVYCLAPTKQLLSFSKYTTRSGATYDVPDKVAYTGGMDFCCTNADCAGTGMSCDIDTFTCKETASCQNNLDCTRFIESSCKRVYPKWEVTGGECIDGQCKKTTRTVVCSEQCPDSCQPGYHCYNEEECRPDTQACPTGRCCDGTGGQDIRTCNNMGYSTAYSCCLNLDSRAGVGVCAKSCGVACDYDGTCEPQFGETVATCTDCHVCGDGLLNSKYETCKTCPEDVITVKGEHACDKPPQVCKPYDIICLFNKYITIPIKEALSNLAWAYKVFALMVAGIGALIGFGISYTKLEKQFKKKEELRIGISLLAGLAVGFMIYQYFGIGAIILAIYIVAKVAMKVV
ncbi:MAG: hypothetical protein DRN66_03770 [Candidatus Nanohalarchaeota archaeon]|nr:MAG: hypothetical protein DRN66_03770 [Candidatus Nanohaloarchaeota archaeon]